jgi:mRNA-degrading endonuclease RelE of RelBE toxin-antitoxin system
MKRIVWLGPARWALLKHRNMAQRIMQNLEGYAADSTSSANPVTEPRGRPLNRMRVRDFRVLLEETDEEILVVDLRPRSQIYDR